MQRFSIKDLENFTGIKAHTIRAWEQRYALLNPQRTSTNIRYYTDDDLKLLLNVNLLYKEGFKISKIAKMSESEIEEQIATLNRAEGEQVHFLNMLKLSMLNYDEALFHEVTDKFLSEYSVLETFNKLFLPFMNQVGVLWLTSAICPAQEHFVSNLIKQKLFRLIDEKVKKPKDETTAYVLYLPEREIHEISLLLAHYLMLESGKKSIFLGQSVPFEDLLAVEKKFKNVEFISICTTTPQPQDAQAYVDNLLSTFTDLPVRFHLTGPVFSNVSSQDEALVQIYPSAHQLIGNLLH